MTTTPAAIEREMKELETSPVEPVLEEWSTFLTEAGPSFDDLHTGSYLFAALAYESSARYLYGNALRDFENGLLSELEYCCALMEVLTHLAKANRNWKRVESNLEKQSKPEDANYIHAKGYVRLLHQRSKTGSQEVIARYQQRHRELTTFAEQHNIQFASGFAFSVIKSE